MKSVGNLNDFVRDHMLEPSDSTQRVREIVSHFEDLTRAHDAVKRAREQLEALGPVASTAEKYDGALAQRDAAEGERAAVRLFVAELRSGLLASEIEALEAEGRRLWAEQDSAKAAQGRLSAERESLIEERAGAGGERIGTLERLAGEAREQAQERLAARARFEVAVADAGLTPVAGAGEFAALLACGEAESDSLAEAKRGLDAEAHDAMAREREFERGRAPIAVELESLEQRTSNLPSEQVDLRAQLCPALGLTAEALPFAGELLDVHEQHAAWRGAAERVLRGFALSLLVPQRHYDAVSQWVNARQLTVGCRGGAAVGARLTYERVPERRLPLRATGDGALLLADCIEIKDGDFREYLAGELAKRADHRRGEPRGVPQRAQGRHPRGPGPLGRPS